MATPYATNEVIADGQWHDVAGAAANVAGVTWQNVGPYALEIAFTAAAPLRTDARQLLNPAAAWNDETGSPHVWVRPLGSFAIVAATGA